MHEQASGAGVQGNLRRVGEQIVTVYYREEISVTNVGQGHITGSLKSPGVQILSSQKALGKLVTRGIMKVIF